MQTSLNFSARLREIEAAHADLPLMQRAGAAAAKWATELALTGEWPVLVLSGPGNNGGDAFEAAHLLRQRFFEVCLVFIGRPEKLPQDAAAAYQRFVDAGGSVLDDIPKTARWSLIIDGLFGIGLQRPAEGRYAELIDAANHLAQRDACPLLALDCPSGLDTDHGLALKPTIQATHTLTFLSGKPGLWTGDGPDYCGNIQIADLGVASGKETVADGHLISMPVFANCLKPRRRNTHKGSFGSVGILGGSPSMVGAAVLAGRTALKLGAGRVYVGLLDDASLTVDIAQPELMLRCANEVFHAELQALACGPGLGQSEQAKLILQKALSSVLPLVLDADALNLLATDLAAGSELQQRLFGREQPVILTPHPAEAARLLGVSVREVQADRVKSAQRLAERYAAFVALKGCGTVIANPEGRWWINPTGNPGMASAGMGDVLTGLIASLLAQGWPAEHALLGSVYLHGAAADWLVEKGIGPIGLTASEIIDAARQLINDWVRDLAMKPAHW